jgi:hypothetical protein
MFTELATAEKDRSLYRDAEITLFELCGTLLVVALFLGLLFVAYVLFSTKETFQPASALLLALATLAYAATAIGLRRFRPRARLAGFFAAIPLMIVPLIGLWVGARLILFLASPAGRRLFTPEHDQLRALTPRMDLMGLYAGTLRVCFLLVAFGIAIAERLPN